MEYMAKGRENFNIKPGRDRVHDLFDRIKCEPILKLTVGKNVGPNPDEKRFLGNKIKHYHHKARQSHPNRTKGVSFLSVYV